MRAGLALAVAALVAVPAAAGGAKARSYEGTTAIDTEVAFTVSAGKARGFAIGYVAHCDDGETLRGQFRFKPARLERGRFAVRGPSSSRLPDGRTTASKLRLTGRVSTRRARGTFSIVTQMAHLDGAGVTTCRSGRIAWTARR